jgi:hypothetical protein
VKESFALIEQKSDKLMEGKATGYIKSTSNLEEEEEG